VAESGGEIGDDEASPEKPDNSIAVLPFANVSNDPDNEAFCDGISEEILHKLAEFGDLHVIGRTSSFAFKGSDYRIPRISALLGVRYLLQGSVRKVGDRLRISAQLVDDSGAQRWSEAFDRRLEDVFAIQTEIADFVATTVLLFAAINYVKLLPYAWLGQLSAGNLATSLVLAPLAPVGVYAGVWLHRRVTDRFFFHLMYVVLFVVGCKLLYDGIASSW
jgi:TolB-like protein